MELNQKEREKILLMAAEAYNSRQMSGFEEWAEAYRGDEISNQYVSCLLHNIRSRNSDASRRLYSLDKQTIEELLTDPDYFPSINRAA